MDEAQQSGGAVRIRRVGTYAIGKSLGEGTFGKVRLGTHLITHERVALKILEKSRIQNVMDMKRITREIQILKLLDHPNVVKLLEVIDTPKHIYLVTEFIEGGELFDYIVSKQRLDDIDACRVFHDIINGVDYCHQRHVIHRDLKPENMLLDSTGRVKLVDFGLSNTVSDESTILKTACGSPCYAAPEMIARKHYDGPGVDIWSSGVVLFALLCGYLPFEDRTTALLYDKILHGRYTSPPFLNEDAKDLISKILVTNPAQRATVTDVRAHPWYNNYYRGPPEDHLLSIPGSILPRRIDFRILVVLEQYGFEAGKTMRSVNANRHNQLTSTYFLLSEREELSRRRKGLPRLEETWVLAEQSDLAGRMGFTIDSNGNIFDAAGEVAAVVVIPPIDRKKDSVDFSKVSGSAVLAQEQRDEQEYQARQAAEAVSRRMATIEENSSERRGRSRHSTTTDGVHGEDESTDRRRRHRTRTTERSDASDAVPTTGGTDEITAEDGESQNRRRRRRRHVEDDSATTPHTGVVPEEVDAGESGVDKIRVHRGGYEPAHTSRLNPVSLMNEVMDGLSAMGIGYKRRGQWRVRTAPTESAVRVEIEVFELYKTDLHLLRFKRIEGQAWDYRTLCNTIVDALKM